MGDDYSIYHHTLFIIILWTLLNTIQYLYQHVTLEKTIKSLKRIKFSVSSRNNKPVLLGSDHSCTFDLPLNDNEEDSNKPLASENEDEPQALSSSTSDWDLRRWLHNYISSLDEGRKTLYEQNVWKWYEKWVPHQYRHINTENGVAYPLPEWLENTIHFLTNFNYIRLFYFITAYIVLFYAHQPIIEGVESAWTLLNNDEIFSWIKSDNIGSSVDLTIHDSLKDYIHYDRILTRFFYYCLTYEAFLGLTTNNITFNVPNDTYCSIQKSSLWIPPVSFEFNYNNRNNATSKLVFIDSNNDIYHTVYHLPVFKANRDDEEEYQEVGMDRKKRKNKHALESKKELMKERDLLNLLHSLDNNGEMCICPFLIGLDSVNMTFFFRKETQQWSILYQPFIYRNNTLSDLVETRPIYDEKSVLYKNFRRFHGDKPIALIHYSIISVEYTSFIKESLETHDDEMKRMTRVEKQQETGNVIFSALTSIEQKRQERITLSGDDAICFIYCTNTI